MKSIINRNNLFVLLVVALIAMLASSALAQPRRKGRGEPPKGRQNEGDILRGYVRLEMMKHLYPIELIRRFGTEIKLTKKQVDQLSKVVAKTGAEIEKLKWSMTLETQKLVGMLAKNATAARLYQQMDRVFAQENKIKKKGLGLMVAIRDILTREQRAKLDAIKAKHGLKKE